MRSWIVRCLLMVAGIAAVGLSPLACSGGNSGTGGSGGSGGGGSSTPLIGVPCLPSSEMVFDSSGYRVTEDLIETGAPDCGGGVCLVNHTQGRVTCPLGQAAPRDAQGLVGCVPELDAQGKHVEGQGSCSDGFLCMQAGSPSPSCGPAGSPEADLSCAKLGAGSKCSSEGYCECNTDADCLFVTDAVVACDPLSRRCVAYACHEPGACQNLNSTDQENAGKACCLPGTDLPVIADVCGQCKGNEGVSRRDADSTVYCSCRCGVAEGEPDEPDFPFCACPLGFECSQIRPYVGLGDRTISGKYCIRSGTAYDANQDQCGLVNGHWSQACAGVPTGKCQTANGPCN